MRYRVVWSRRIEKQISKCPQRVQEAFFLLVDDIIISGPIQKNWRNFSDLGKDRYHCHLGYHWVACWEWKKKSIVVEVYYVGNRENSPY